MIGNETFQDYASCRDTILARVREPAPGRVQVLTGPRQVGKTTLLLELASVFGQAAHYHAGDDPHAALPGAWERIWTEAEATAGRGGAVLLLDEVQHFPDWAARVKSRWDRIRRERTALQVVVSGSSAVRLGAGSRESLAGRFERLTLSHWSATSVAKIFGLTKEAAALAVVTGGSYPGAFELRSEPARWRAYIRDAIVEPAIGRDLLALASVRRPGLVRQIFAVAVGMPAEIVSLQKLQGQLQDGGALETVAHYLNLLQEACLVAGLEKYGGRAHRRRAAPPKLITLNNALLAAMHRDGPPDQDREPGRFGRWVENACIAHAVNSGQGVTYWREEPLELDAVIDGSWGPWAVEIKTGRFEPKDLDSLLEFSRRYPRYRPLLITGRGGRPAPRIAGLTCIDWVEFLSSGPPATEGLVLREPPPRGGPAEGRRRRSRPGRSATRRR